jgi:hypothetical protein
LRLIWVANHWRLVDSIRLYLFSVNT